MFEVKSNEQLDSDVNTNCEGNIELDFIETVLSDDRETTCGDYNL